MAEAVYMLCILTCLVCAVLLLKSYRRQNSSLLFWAALCFAAFTANNLLLYLDMVVVGNEIDLSLPRIIVATVGVASLLFGLIWETT